MIFNEKGTALNITPLALNHSFFYQSTAYPSQRRLLLFQNEAFLACKHGGSILDGKTDRLIESS